MLVSLLLAALQLLEVHGPDGQVAYINTHEISTLRAPRAQDREAYFAKGARCIVVTTNGKFIATREPCNELRDRLTTNRQPP